MSNQQNSYEKRSDVPKEYTWAMEDLYASDAEWQKIWKSKEPAPADRNLPRAAWQSADSLLAFLKLQDDIVVLMDKLQTTRCEKRTRTPKTQPIRGTKTRQ